MRNVHDKHKILFEHLVALLLVAHVAFVQHIVCPFLPLIVGQLAKLILKSTLVLFGVFGGFKLQSNFEREVLSQQLVA
jgi:hypothetical protein